MISFMQAVPAATMPIPASAHSSLMVSTGRPDLCCAEEEAAPGSDHHQSGHANLGELRIVAQQFHGAACADRQGLRGGGRHALHRWQPDGGVAPLLRPANPASAWR